MIDLDNDLKNTDLKPIAILRRPSAFPQGDVGKTDVARLAAFIESE